MTRPDPSLQFSTTRIYSISGPFIVYAGRARHLRGTPAAPLRLRMGQQLQGWGAWYNPPQLVIGADNSVSSPLTSFSRRMAG